MIHKTEKHTWRELCAHPGLGLNRAHLHCQKPRCYFWHCTSDSTAPQNRDWHRFRSGFTLLFLSFYCETSKTSLKCICIIKFYPQFFVATAAVRFPHFFFFFLWSNTAASAVPAKTMCQTLFPHPAGCCSLWWLTNRRITGNGCHCHWCTAPRHCLSLLTVPRGVMFHVIGTYAFCPK